MRRREFIAGLGGAVAWPLAAWAQQTDRVRRIGVLLGNVTEDDQGAQVGITAFRDGLAKLGWVEGRNLRIDLRFGGLNPERFHAYAEDLVNLGPDVIVSATAPVTRALQQQTQTIPIVITGVGDPIVNGIVKSLAHPEGNTTGVTNLYPSIGGKWLQLLKEATPQIERVAIIYNAQVNQDDGGYGYFSPIEEVARVLSVQAIKIPYRDAVDIVHGIDAFAAEPNGGLVVVPPSPNVANRETIFRLAIQHRLPAIYAGRLYAIEGGLMAYGSDDATRFRRAASFVDRILRGTKVSELPVEFPTKFELVINLKSAKAMGLTIPESFLLRADEVIE